MGKKLTPQEKTLDRWFSKYIRLRDTPCPCPTCGKFVEFDKSDCGHFISRDYHAVRWDERNASAQCQKCNRFSSGKQYEHGLHVDKVHGKGTADLLLFKSKHPVSFTKDEIKAMTDYFKQRCKEL